MKIIDARCRLTIPEAGNYFRESASQFDKEANLPLNMEDFFIDIGRGNISTAIAVNGNNPGRRIGKRMMPDRTTSNELLGRLQKAHWGKLICVGGIDVSNTFHNALEEIGQCIEFGLRAIFIEPGRSPGCYLDDKILYPIYEKCSKHGLVVVPQTSGVVGGENIEYANPKYIDRVAQDFPSLRILAGHACYPYYREAIVVAGRHENVYLSPDIYLFHMGTKDWVDEVNANYFGLQDRFLYGTAYPAGMHPEKYLKKFLALPWNEEILPKLLWMNALKLFGLENDPVYASMYRQ